MEDNMLIDSHRSSVTSIMFSNIQNELKCANYHIIALKIRGIKT